MRQLYVRVERTGWLRWVLGRYHYEPMDMAAFVDTTPLPILEHAVRDKMDIYCQERRNPFNQTGMPRGLTGRDRRRKYD